MTTTTGQATWNDWIGADVVDRDGDKIGSLQQVYMDRATGRPEWLAVRTGLFGMKDTFIPLEGVGADGAALQVPYEKAFVKDAPNVDSEDGFLPGEEEERLYTYYSRQDYRPWDDEQDTDVHREETADAGRTATVGTGGDDDAMTRSEEELVAGTRTREAGRARLRKYVVTENVTTTVPVRKEKLRVEREPITDANVDAATSGPEISEAEHEVVLHEEQAVVDTKVVPKERVRLDTEVEEREEEVGGEIRKERIDLDDDVSTKR